MPKVDIIIRAKNGHEMTRTLIESIHRMTKREDFRLILVDDGSSPPYEQEGTDYCVRHVESRGAVSATNSGLALSLQYSDSLYVLVMDNDTRIPEGDVRWLDRFIAEIERYSDCAAVGATSNFVDGRQHILVAPGTYTADWEKGQKDNPAMPTFVSFCVLLLKDAVRQVGLWDERYNPGNFEDTDYAMQLRVARWSVRVARDVYIHHDGHKTFGTGTQFLELMQRNREKFYRKWGVGRLWDMWLLDDQKMSIFLRLKAEDEQKAVS